MNSKQAGGIVGFVLVGLVLVGLLGGGIYLSKSQARQARESNDTAPTVLVKTPETKDASKPKETKPEAKDTAPATAPTSQTSSTSTTTPSQQTTTQVAATGPSGQLPSTGPAETTLTIMALGTLAFSIYHFSHSRRDFRHKALGR